MDIIYLREPPYQVNIKDCIYSIDYSHLGPAYYCPINQKNYLFRNYGITWVYDKGDFKNDGA